MMEESLIYPELSFKIVGILFDIHSKLGNRLHEKYYQRAIAALLKKEELSFEEQVPVNILIEGEKIGKYFLDFLIDDKVILEIKTIPFLKQQDFNQLKGYLKTTGYKLGILANFRSDSLIFKRVVNIY